MFSLIYARINSWVNNRGAGDLRRHRVHYDVIVMLNAQHYRMVGMQIVLFSFVFGNTTFLKGHSVEPYIELIRLDFKCHCNTSLATETNIETSTETFDFSFRPWEIHINRGFYSSYEYINKNTHTNTHTHTLIGFVQIVEIHVLITLRPRQNGRHFADALLPKTLCHQQPVYWLLCVQHHRYHISLALQTLQKQRQRTWIESIRSNQWLK